MIFFNKSYFFLKVIIILCHLSCYNLDRIKTKIYKSLEHKHKCFRRLNATNQIGCNTKESGSVGVVYLVNSQLDLKYVIETGEHYPYVPVITAKYFNFETLNKLNSSSNRISGLLVLDKEVSQVKSHSSDKSCPNNYFEFYANNDSYSHCRQQMWNLVDNRNNDNINENLMFNDWPFPIFLIRNEKNITELVNCFDNFHKSWPLCSAQLTTSSYAAKDVKTCIRRSYLNSNPMNFVQRIDFCRPFTAYNMFSTLFTTNTNFSIKSKSVIVLASRLDSFSMFSDMSPGADTVISSLVTFLSIVHTLSQQSIKQSLKAKELENNVLFALFDGEAFDYIGSSRAVYDMSTDSFPVNPKSKNSLNISNIRTKHFSHFIELNQLVFRGSEPQKQTLYMHKNFHSEHVLNDLQTIIKNNAKNNQFISFESIADNAPLPPSSLQSFLKDDNSLIGLVITNHQKEYTNKFYNSIYDNLDQLNRRHNLSIAKLAIRLTNIATVISKSIYDLLIRSQNMTKTNEMSNITADQDVVESLLSCYLINSNCSLFNTVFEAKDNPNVTYETYIGSIYHSMFSKYTFMLLSYFNGQNVETVQTKKDCYNDTIQDKRFDYTWIPGPSFNGMCVRSHSVLQSRVSPAFVDYKSKGIVNSSLYSTWTQSLSSDISLKIFVRDSPLQQWLTFITGIVILITSIIIIIYCQYCANHLFNLPEKSNSYSTEKKTIESEFDST